LENGHRTTGPIGYNFEVLLAAPNHSILQRSMLRNFSGGSICLPNNSKSLVGNSSQLIPHDPTQSTCPAVVAPWQAPCSAQRRDDFGGHDLMPLWNGQKLAAMCMAHLGYPAK
jgi:hypothetical protein